MNDRIKSVTDNRVVIQLNESGAQYSMTIDGDKIRCDWVTRGQNIFDAAGGEAEVLCITCWRQTGSFAALSDESAVPFAGKLLRVKGWSNPFVVTAVYDDQKLGHQSVIGDVQCWEQRPKRDIRGAKLCVELSNLLPLSPPKPRVRPYVPVEAAAHLGRRFVYLGGGGWKARGVLALHVIYYRDGDEHEGQLSFDKFAKDCVWADTNEPCGIVE